MKNEPFMPAILARLAPRMKAKVLLEPEYRIVGRIRFPNGRQSLFWHNKFNLNSVGSARIASDKGYTSLFLSADGIRVPKFATFFDAPRCRTLRSDRNLAAACRFADAIGWPVYVKPCRGSQGDGVEKVTNRPELKAAARRIFKKYAHTLLLQETCVGRDYRLVILDGELISAYERVPLSVVGDGRSSVKELLQRRQQRFVNEGRDTQLDFGDHRLRTTLKRLRLTLLSVPPRGKTIRLLDVANLSCGGDSIEMTRRVHSSFVEIANRAAAALDLRFAGIDIIAPDISRRSAKYVVLEVNSAPGLDHYAEHGATHDQKIDNLYLRVLRAIERGPEVRPTIFP